MPTMTAASRGAPPAKTGWALAPGSAIAPGRTVVELLGGGRRTEVYLVEDERLGTAVAKILRPDRLADGASVRRLRREASLLARLAHPALVRGLGADLEGRYPHVLLEYLDAPSLGEVVADVGPPAAELVARIGVEVASGLAYLEREGIVHLDVKPGNVVLDGQPCLIDLGAARPLAEAARLRVPHGTDRFMAPELCAPGSAPIGSPADVWSLGATLYAAATGLPPFPRARRAARSTMLSERFPQLVLDPPAVPDYVPAPLADAILGLLARDPQRRPTASEAAGRFRALL